MLSAKCQPFCWDLSVMTLLLQVTSVPAPLHRFIYTTARQASDDLYWNDKGKEGEPVSSIQGLFCVCAQPMRV